MSKQPISTIDLDQWIEASSYRDWWRQILVTKPRHIPEVDLKILSALLTYAPVPPGEIVTVEQIDVTIAHEVRRIRVGLAEVLRKFELLQKYEFVNTIHTHEDINKLNVEQLDLLIKVFELIPFLDPDCRDCYRSSKLEYFSGIPPALTQFCADLAIKLELDEHRRIIIAQERKRQAEKDARIDFDVQIALDKIREQIHLLPARKAELNAIIEDAQLQIDTLTPLIYQLSEDPNLKNGPLPENPDLKNAIRFLTKIATIDAMSETTTTPNLESTSIAIAAIEDYGFWRYGAENVPDNGITQMQQVLINNERFSYNLRALKTQGGRQQFSLYRKKLRLMQQVDAALRRRANALEELEKLKAFETQYTP